mgnify:CR=1 FL=1
MKKKVAIQGIAGSYHDIAARNYHEGEEIEIILQYVSGCYHDDQERPVRTRHDGHREYDSGKPPSKP